MTGAVFRQGFWDLGRSVERRGLRSTSEGATNPEPKRPAEKKWPLRRAAKFREETPRKGGGLAIRDRDTALQQYEEKPPYMQRTKYNNSRQNAAENLGKHFTNCPLFVQPAAHFGNCAPHHRS